MLATMAGTDMTDMGQFSTYLFVYVLPTIIQLLLEDSIPQKTTVNVFLLLLSHLGFSGGISNARRLNGPKSHL